MTNSKFPQDNQDKNQFNNNIIQALTRNWATKMAGPGVPVIMARTRT